MTHLPTAGAETSTPVPPPAPVRGAITPRTAGLGLMTSAVLLAVSAVTQPQLSGGAAGKLAAIASAGARADLSAVLFAIAQLPFMFGVLGVGALLRPGSRRLASIGTGLAVAGAFGHALFGGVSLTYLVMAREPAGLPAYARLVTDIESSPVMLVSVVGLAGTVLGLLLLSIGLFRTGTGPRWVGPTLWAFLVVEFAGGAASAYASYVSSVLLVVAFFALARTLRDASASTVQTSSRIESKGARVSTTR
jgi:hypothetical protein